MGLDASLVFGEDFLLPLTTLEELSRALDPGLGNRSQQNKETVSCVRSSQGAKGHRLQKGCGIAVHHGRYDEK